ncbi:MAG: hypothetical protein DCC75_07870, partial [Proteobacteria bacterium]
FEKNYGKRKFASFGISRGAINVAMTAGVDKRLKYNVLVMGGSDIVGIFKHSNQRRLSEYRHTVMEAKGITEDEFYRQLSEQIKSDPKYLAKYMNARDTLLILGVFDRTVPYKYGRKLRKALGLPRTLYLVANHYTGLLFTQFIKAVPPVEPLCIFPLNVVEAEAMDFYDRTFTNQDFSWRLLPLKVIRVPIDLMAWFIDWVF